MRLLASIFFITLFAFKSQAQTALFISDKDALHINSALISTDGNVKNEGSISGDYNSILYLNGKLFQYVGDTLSDTFYLGSIYQDNRAGVCYNSNIHLYNDTGYWFKKGSAFTNNRDLWFRNNAEWVDNNITDQFFVNKGLGLIYKPNSGPGITYPVGFDSFANAYAPIVLENFGTPDNFGVRVQKGLDFHYKQPYGTPDSAPILMHAVNNTWIINEEVKGGTRLLYTPIWQSNHELPGFYRPNSIVAWYSDIDHTWHWEDHQPASGSNPYSARKIDTLFQGTGPLANFDYMPVSVGDIVSPLPFEYINLTTKWQSNSPLLNAKYQFDEQVQKIAILRSNNGINFSVIDTLKISSASGTFTYLDKAFIKNKSKGRVYYIASALNHMNEVNSNASSLYFSNTLNTVLFPNPATTNVNIYYPVQQAVNASVKMYSTSGRLLLDNKYNLDENNHLINIKIEEIPAGVYQIVLLADNQRTVFRFIKE